MWSSISIYHHTSFDPHQFLNVRMQANINDFMIQSVKQQFVPLFHLNLTQKKYQDVQLELFQHHIKIHTHHLKSVRKWSGEVLLCVHLMAPSQGQDQWKWYKMEEVNCAYRHGRYKKNWLKSWCAMSNVKVFATQNGWTNTTNSTDLYVTHMNQQIHWL